MGIDAGEVAQVAATLFPNYDMIQPLDSGGMGLLFKGRKISLNVPVVIKKIKKQYKGRLDEMKEADILKSLKHKYLPRIYDVIESSDGFLYTVMDFIPGDNLKRYIRKNGVPDQKTVYKWGQQLCEVVSYLHEQTPPIIHSDIKPSNVMITPQGDICLIDFNTSLVYTDGLTAIGKTKGYAAPEQYTFSEQMTVQNKKQDSTASTADSRMRSTIPLDKDATIAATSPFPMESGVSQTSNTDSKSLSFGSFSNQNPSISASVRSSSVFSSQISSGQINYGSISKRTDVYAIGATLYYTVSAKDPPSSLEKPIPISALRLPIGKALVQIIERAMQQQPALRFADAKAMGQAFQDIYRLEDDYRRTHTLTVVCIAAETALIVGGVALMAAGMRRIQLERQTDYDKSISEAQHLRDDGDYEGALEKIQAAQEITGMDTRLLAYTEEAVLYYTRASHTADTAQREQDYDRCVETVHEILSSELTADNSDEWVETYFVGAESSVQLEEYDQAESWYKKALTYKQDENCYMGLIYVQILEDDAEGAQETLDAMEDALDTQDSEEFREAQLMVQAEYDMFAGNNADALDNFRELAEMTADQAQLKRICVFIGTICTKTAASSPELLPKIIEALEISVGKLDGVVHDTYMPLLASAYTYQGMADSENANNWYRKAEHCYLSMDASSMTVTNGLELAMLQQTLEDFSGAEATLLNLTKTYPDDYRPYMRLSYLYMAQANAESDYNYTKKSDSAYDAAKLLYQDACAGNPSLEDAEMQRLETIMKDRK